MGKVACGSRYLNISVYASPVANNILTDEDEPESSGEEDTSVEIISTPNRPITRSVSAKRAADTMDDGDVSLSSPPRPTKVQRGIGKPGTFIVRCEWPVANLVIGLQKKIPLFTHSPSPEPIEVASTPNTADTNVSSHLDKDYFEFENPWTHPIMYF